MPILPQVSLPPGMVAVPENRAKAAAFDRWMAQGKGNPQKMKRGGKFPAGPMKGLTYDEAKQRFEGMWGSAPDALKEKYAKRAGNETQMAPSQRPAPEKVDMSPLAVQKRRMAAYGHEFDANGRAVPIGQKTSAKPAYDKDRNGVPDMIQRPATVNPAATSGAGRGTPEERAKVAQMVNDGGDFATADTGDQAMKAALAMSEKDRRTGPGGMYSSEDRQKARDFAESEIAKNRPMRDAIDMTNYTGKPVSAAVEQTPLERLLDETGDAIAGASRSASNWIADKVTAPFTPPSERIVNQESEAVRRTLEAKRAAEADAEQRRLSDANAARLRSERGLPSPSPAPVVAPGTTVADGAMKRKVNSLTGLPMGYSPGDALPTGADSAMKARADASTARMNSAAPPPRAIPVVTPARPPSVEQRAAAEMRRQAAMNANPSRVNPDDPRKFFTGRVKPLDQLVAASRPAYR